MRCQADGLTIIGEKIVISALGINNSFELILTLTFRIFDIEFKQYL